MPNEQSRGPVEFRVLGPIKALIDGRPADLGPPKRRLLLALLLLECGHPLPVDRLIDRLWQVAPPAGKRVVYAHVARLRKTLSSAAEYDVALTSSPSGYTLHVDPDCVDVHVFRRLVNRAAIAKDTALRSKLLQEGLCLWQGPALENLASGSSAQSLAHGLEELRLIALEDRVEADLAAGLHGTLVTELTQLVAEHPLRERMTGHLMLALYRCGDAGAALQNYRRARAALAAELGVDPGPELNGLHEAILRRDPSLAAARPTVLDHISRDGPEQPSPDVASDGRNVVGAVAQLPAAAFGFTARAMEIGRLDAWRQDARRSGQPVAIIAITGTAGIGKTTLAVHWAHQVSDHFPDGQLYVNLRGFDPSLPPMAPAEAVRGFLEALALPTERIPANLDAQLGLYRSLLSGKRMLVVLDNAATSEQARALLPGSAGCMALVTSRNQLGGLVTAEGAHPLALDTLTVGQARQLLTARIGRIRADAEPDAIDAIISRCGGLPLALAIVAARAAIHPGFPLAELAGELHDDRDRLDALDGGDSATRVRDLFSWSYRRLNPDAARLFRLLGLHRGPDLGAAAAASLAAVAVDRVRPLLTELTDAHLIEEHVPRRYSFHDLLRAYAREQALSSGDGDERQAALRRMFDHYLHTGHAAAMQLNPHRQPITLDPAQPGVALGHTADREQALDWFAAERPGLIAASAWACENGFSTHAWKLAWTCTTFFERRGHWFDLASTQSIALDAARKTDDRVGQANAHYGLARAYSRTGRHDEARTQFQHALELFRELGDGIRQARAALGLAWIADLQGRGAAALDHARQALDLAYTTDGQAIRANALNAVGWYHARLGDGLQALAHCRQALKLQEELGDLNGQATTWDSLGYAHHLLGQDEQALDDYRHAIDLYRELGDRYYEADTLAHLGQAHQALRGFDAARAAWQQALDILTELQHPDVERVRAELTKLTRYTAQTIR